ncbi:MAG TPA: glycosyltransferase family 39 protein, partial [Terriglobales bacterium]|nr:glycosyltransferase family 39 protein [Terriglobales bacterium]
HVLLVWAAVAIAFSAAACAALIPRSFAAEPHGWVSSHMALMARSFVEEGVVKLRGVPIQNNPPLGNYPDGYIHWPPLFTIVLSFVFRIFGESETVAHAFAVVVRFATVFALYKLVKLAFGRSAALGSAFGLLVLPISTKYATLLLPANAAVLAGLFAVYAFLRDRDGLHAETKWRVLGAIAVVVGVLFSWEAALFPAALLLACIIQRSLQPALLATMWTLAAALVAVAVLIFYLVSSPYLASNLAQSVRYRISGTLYPSAGSLHELADEADKTDLHPGIREWMVMATQRMESLGPGAIACTLLALTWSGKQRYLGDGRRGSLVLWTLLLIPLMWFAVFRNHVYIHEYTILLFAPLSGTCVGVALARTLGLLDEHAAVTSLRVLRPAAAVIFPLVLAAPLAWETGRAFYGNANPQPEWILNYARDIHESTPPTAVVASPLLTMVPVYYSRRHILRGIRNDQAVEAVRRQGPVEFPGTPLYLALPPLAQEQFACSMARYPVVKITASMTLLAISEGGQVSLRSPGAPVAQNKDCIPREH